MRILKKFTILQLALLSSILFALSFLVFVSRALVDSWQSYQGAQSDGYLVELFLAAEDAAHHHAIERGLTAGYLGAATMESKQRLDQQRIKADTTFQALKAQLSEQPLNITGLDKIFAEVNLYEARKRQIRNEVDLKNGSASFSYYSDFIRLLLDAANLMSAQITLSEVSEEVNLGLLLATRKERLGQIRGKINGTLAKQQITQTEKRDLLYYANELQLATKYLSNLLVKPMKSQFQSTLNNDIASEFAKVFGQVSQSEGSIAVQMSPKQWFTLATEYIGQAKAILDQRLNLVSQLSENEQQKSLFVFTTLLVVASVIILITLFINWVLIKTLKVQLSELSSNLDEVAKRGDLTIDVSIASHNELGTISNAMHTTLSSIKQLILGVYASVAESKTISDELENVKNVIYDGAEQSEQNATAIASAIEEMASTSEEITASASQTLTETSHLNDSVSKAVEVSLASQGAMEELSSNLESVQALASQMEQKVGEISGFLDTINSLSEQTNLLALNAAIEAARAGEHGRGFAVVADEVRSLAQGSKTSSDQIANLLQELIKASGDVAASIDTNVEQAKVTAKRSEETRDITNELACQVANVEQLATSVSAASEQQAITARQMARDVTLVLDCTRQQLESADALKHLFGRIEDNSSTIQQRIGSFTIETAS